MPDSCTLPSAERPLRSEEFDQLLRQSAQRVDRVSATHARVTLDHDAELAATVARLSARETQCCSFFTFTLTLAATEVALDVSVPATKSDVLDGLLALGGPA